MSRRLCEKNAAPVGSQRDERESLGRPHLRRLYHRLRPRSRILLIRQVLCSHGDCVAYECRSRQGENSHLQGYYERHTPQMVPHCGERRVPEIVDHQKRGWSIFAGFAKVGFFFLLPFLLARFNRRFPVLPGGFQRTNPKTEPALFRSSFAPSIK